MNEVLRLNWKLGAIFAVVISVLFLVMQAQANSFGNRERTLFRGQPALISMTGTLYRPDEKVVTGMHTVSIYINDKETWVFDIKEARDITGFEPGLSLIDHLFPSKLTFWGPKKLITSLTKPELDKKVITIEGYLHGAYNTLDVKAVKSVS